MKELNRGEMLNLAYTKEHLHRKMSSLLTDINNYRRITGNNNIHNLTVPYIVYEENFITVVNILKNETTDNTIWNDFKFNDNSKNNHIILDIVYSNNMSVPKNIKTEYNYVILYTDDIIRFNEPYTIKCITIEEISINDLFKLYTKLLKKYNDKLIELNRWETTRTLLMG